MADRPDTLPEWDTDETNLTPADAAHKLDGWLEVSPGIGEKPPLDYFNWFMNLVYKWILYFTGLNISLTFSTISEMRNSTITPIAGQKANVLGYDTLGDGGGGPERYWVTGDAPGTHVDDGGSVIVRSGGDGSEAWLWSYVGDADPLWWGAKSDLGSGDTNNAVPITAAIDWLKLINNAIGGKLIFSSSGSGYLTGEVTTSNYEGLIVTSNNVKIKMIDTGTNNYIFLFNSCKDIDVCDFRMIGTSGTVAVYDDANRQAGVGVDGGSIVKVHDCVFQEFISFGVFSTGMSPSTTVEGMRVYNNVFRDFPLDAAAVEQCGVYLESEYSILSGNTFQNIPSAARFIDGANSKFIENIVMNLNGQNNDTTAAFYHEPGDNFGKLLIAGNTFNHIDSGQVIVHIIGDIAIERNPCIIDNNQLLSNGTDVNSKQLIIEEMSRTRVTNNTLRPNLGLTWASGDDNIRIKDSNNVLVENNYCNYGDYAITTDNSSLIIGRNDFENQATGILQTLNSGTWKSKENRSFGFNVLEAGTAGTDIWDDEGVTIPTHTTTGVYEFAHSFGSENYTVSVTTDESQPSAERHFDVIRRAAVFDITCRDAAGALIDQEFVVTVTHGIDSEYLLGLY